VTASLAAALAAPSYLQPMPGWVLGAGQNASWAMRLRKVIWRQFRRPFILPWLDGLQVVFYPGNEMSRSIFVTGLYDPNELSFLSRVLKPGMTFVDAGANMGLYSLFAARKVGTSGRVLAIEPSQREQAILRRNVELNDLMNVSIVAVALSDQPGELDLMVAPLEKSGHNTLGAAFGHGAVLDHKERVRVVRLDDLLEEQGVGRVDVLKIDIEGGEERALRGAARTLQRHRPVILMELSQKMLQHQQSSEARVLKLLAEFGYRVSGFDSLTGLPTGSPKLCSEENVIAVYGRRGHGR
jgi:FkbM family methyltransferase